MVSRPVILASLLGASIGVPYVATHAPELKNQLSGWQSSSSTPAPAAIKPGQPSKPVPFESPGSTLYTSQVPLEGSQFRSLSQVFRFDLTKEWIYQNWARKSTGLADPEMFGVRVPLVTGTGMTDLAGSLTYYFNEQGQVQQIAFTGRTADTTQLVQFITTTYKLERVEAPPGQQLYQKKLSGLVQSQLRTQPDGVLWNTSPHGSFVVDLVLERPGSNRTLPPQVPMPELPPDTTPPPAAQAAGAEGAAAGEQTESGVMGTIFPEGARYATPQEAEQVFRQRWPN